MKREKKNRENKNALQHSFSLSLLLIRGEEIGIIFTCLQSAQNVQIYTREREDNNRGKRKE
ncbi:unnamed protein product [Bathycoccus prasinos]